MRPSRSAGSPALGFTTTGTEAHETNFSTAGSISRGPSEQLRPTAHTPIPSKRAHTASGEAPVIILQSEPNTPVAITGRPPPYSPAASTAALSSYKSFIVSMAIRSAPAALPAAIVLPKIFTASSKSRSPSGFKSLPVGPISRATNLSLSPLHAAFAHLTAAVTTSSVRSPNLRLFAPKVLV